MLQFYNSLTRTKQVFTPIHPGQVRMYVCGMTVYDFCHIGHARVLVVFDTLFRYLRYRGYEVTYVRNITDIDDKIIQRANERGEDFRQLTERFIAAMHQDTEALGVLPPTHEPKATDNLDAILGMIERLIEHDAAYRAENGDVYYSVAGFPGYGRLSGKNIADLRAGARVEVDEAKRDPLDFVLWKSAKPDEPAWDSPWGRGRPGWHIECSAMSTRMLGDHFDIHGGGQDLQFPHHENEIAQSEACTGSTFVNYWLHNGFVRVNEEKMSKSLGNFFTVREVLERYQPETVRYFILSSHYRSPLNYSDQQLDHAHSALSRLYTALRGSDAGVAADAEGCEHRERFLEAMDDDMNTPEAISVLFDLARALNRERDEGDPAAAARLAARLRALGGVLGLLQDDPEAYLRGGDRGDGLSDAEIDELVARRVAARAARDWAEADRVRDLLAEQGVALEDGAEGTRWRRQ